MTNFLSISVITPSFNQGRFIERTIRSVLDQSIPDLEYVILDGGSTDHTADVVNPYADRLRFISEPDRGQAHAVNKGLAMTKGEIIGWLNSDDVYYPEALKSVCDYFAKHPEIDVIYGDANHIDEQDGFIEKYPTQAWDRAQLKKTCFISQPAVFFRRRVILQVGLLNESLQYCMDYEYWLRLAFSGARFSYVPLLLAGSRLYPQTKTLKAPLLVQQETLAMLKNRLGRVPHEWIIKQAALCLKTNTSFRFPKKCYIVALWAKAFYLEMRWNRTIIGLLRAVLILPIAMYSIYKKRKCRAN